MPAGGLLSLEDRVVALELANAALAERLDLLERALTGQKTSATGRAILADVTADGRVVRWEPMKR